MRILRHAFVTDDLRLENLIQSIPCCHVNLLNWFACDLLVWSDQWYNSSYNSSGRMATSPKYRKRFNVCSSRINWSKVVTSAAGVATSRLYLSKIGPVAR